MIHKNDNNKKDEIVLHVNRRALMTIFVLIVFSIVICFGTVFLKKHDKYKEYNEWARTIYFAAQDSLNQMSEDDYKSLLTAMNVYTEDDRATAYCQVKGGADSSGIAIFEQLTKGYIYNNDVLQYALGIEFDVDSRKVISAACTDEDVMLTREGLDGRNHINFKNKDEKQRKKENIGYYDEAMLSVNQDGDIGDVILKNEDVLEVVFSLKEAQKMRIGQFAYEVIMRNENDEKIMRLEVNSNRNTHLLPANDVADEKYVVAECRFYGKEASDTQEIMKFPAYIDSNYQAHIIFDAIDLASAYANKFTDSQAALMYTDSFSAMRIAVKTGLDASEKVSVGVCFKGQSDDEVHYSSKTSIFMGEDSTKDQFTIQNARHLFNIRFTETNNGPGNVYEQTDSFAWGNIDFGIVGAGHVFERQSKVLNAEFIPIERLCRDSILRAKSECVIEGMYLNNIRREDRFGVFKENHGKIENLTFHGFKIDSNNNYTSALCGINTGSITGVTVKDGEISGGMYVGGIAGWQEGVIQQCSYEGDIDAWGFAGGICGAQSESGLITDSFALPAVYVKEGYGGGIAGYNQGTIADSTVSCDLQSEEGVRLLKAIAKNGQSGDCVGGLIGYNEGRLVAKKQMNTVPVIFGRNFTGGIVGYNAQKGIIGDYRLEGGYIKGRACVGGITGFNSAEAFFDESVVRTAKPDKIYGDYYVGGILGANVIAPQKTTISFLCSVDQENGEVIASGGIIGGVIGYNALVKNELPMEVHEIDDIISDPDEMARCLVDVTWDRRRIPNSIQQITEKLDNLNLNTSEKTLKIISKDEVHLKRLEGNLYVGGVIGMQHQKSSLILDKLNVCMQISADETMTAYGEKFAYAGALMGRVTKETTLFECSVSEETKVSHSGTYWGLITELNEGVIEACNSPGADNENRNRVGAIAGLNAKRIVNQDMVQGTILRCTLSGAVSGNAVVGGITAVNEGTIAECMIEADVSAVKNTVGGVTGINQGSVISCEIKATGPLETQRMITGENNVGGFIGMQKGSSDADVSHLVFPKHAKVNGKSYVGGIVGMMTGHAIYTKCESYGNIMAAMDMAGGISGNVSENSVLRDCFVEDLTISAPDAGYVGGITGFNAGEISGATVCGDIAMTGIWRVGGITGENTGSIKTSSVKEIHLTLKEDTKGGCVGGIAGENTGLIENSTAEQNTKTEKENEIYIQSWVINSYAGGIAGKNSGKIISTNAAVQINTGAVIEFVNHASGAVGGVAGENTGEIRFYRFTGNIENGGRRAVFAGGIAGINGSMDGNKKAIIDSCFVADRDLNEAALTAKNKLDNGRSKTIFIENTLGTIGGIAGINYKNAVIHACVPVKCYIVAKGGILGGIVGNNQGELVECRAKKTGNGDVIRVKLYSEGGIVGAISGQSEDTAIVKDCVAGIDWYYQE